MFLAVFYDKYSTCTIYSQGAHTQIMKCRKLLKHLKKGSDSINDYLKRAKNLFDTMAALQASIFIGDILEGLDFAYHPFIRAIEA